MQHKRVMPTVGNEFSEIVALGGERRQKISGTSFANFTAMIPEPYYGTAVKSSDESETAIKTFRRIDG